MSISIMDDWRNSMAYFLLSFFLVSLSYVSIYFQILIFALFILSIAYAFFSRYDPLKEFGIMGKNFYWNIFFIRLISIGIGAASADAIALSYL